MQAPERTSPLYERIYAVLREQIEDGSLPRGLVLGESAVARAFQASRIPAGMALKRLLSEGLIADFDGRGYLINPGSGTIPVRLDLEAAGLRLPAGLTSERALRNRRQRIYPEVEHAVAASLSYGRFLLNESALAEHYRVSRTVAHEVLTRLERTGLVAQDRNQRWYAGPLTTDLLREHYEMRWLLEPIALGQVMASLDPGEIDAKIRRAERGIDGRLPSHDLELLERDLHVEIVLRCHNSQLRETIRRSQLPIIATHASFAHTRHRAEIVTMVSEHLSVLGSLRRGNAAAAMRALGQHLRRSLDPNIELVRHVGPLPESLRPPYLVPA